MYSTLVEFIITRNNNWQRDKDRTETLTKFLIWQLPHFTSSPIGFFVLPKTFMNLSTMCECIFALKASVPWLAELSIVEIQESCLK